MPEYHPPVGHYNRGAVQPIDFMESNFTPDEYRGFLKGQVIKYIARYRYKEKPLGDLEKAKTYLDWLIEFERERAIPESHGCSTCHGRGHWYSQNKVGKKIYPVGPLPCETCGVSPFSRKYQAAHGIVHRNVADDILEASNALDKAFLEDIERQVASKVRGRRKHEKTTP